MSNERAIVRNITKGRAGIINHDLSEGVGGNFWS